MHENLAQDTLIQAHAGERVDITLVGGKKTLYRVAVALTMHSRK
jgi:uncharacterized protein Veg